MSGLDGAPAHERSAFERPTWVEGWQAAMSWLYEYKGAQGAALAEEMATRLPDLLMTLDGVAITDAEVAAAATGWRVAHDEACRLGPLCSAHQPLGAEARRPRLVEALLSDPAFAAAKGRDDG